MFLIFIRGFSYYKQTCPLDFTFIYILFDHPTFDIYFLLLYDVSIMVNDVSNYSSLSNSQLMRLLFTEEDRLPRVVVDEFIRRGEKLIPALGKIISNEDNWCSDSVGCWAVVHASFIMAALESDATLPYLIKVLLFSNEYECDWVYQEVPSMFNRRSPDALEHLRRIAKDRSLESETRTCAMEAMAAVTINSPETSEKVFGFIAGIMQDESDDELTRCFAGSILMDFRQHKYRDYLLKIGREQKDGEERVFYDEEVIEALANPKPHLRWYTRNWLEFYDDGNIHKRQVRWAKEAGCQWRCEKGSNN